MACRRERGQSLIEAALVIPLLLLLLAGVAELGRAFYNYIVITNAAREGARYASLFPHYADGILAATTREAALGHVSLAGCAITIDPDPRDGPPQTAGNPVTVQVTCPYTTIIGNLLGLSAPITLQNRATMVVFGLD